jgi:hypothetical protein
MWEYVIEFNEKVSINDMIVTPLSGLALGEFFNKLALDLSSAPETPLTWTLGLSVHSHRKVDGLAPPRRKLWRERAFGYGFGVVESADHRTLGTHVVGFAGRFASLPGYAASGAGGRWFHDADVASFDLELDLSARGPGVDIFSETLLVGYHARDLAGALRPRGVSAIGALAVSYHFRNSEGFGFDDRQGLLLFPGLVSETGFRRGAFSFDLALGAYPSFGGMSAPSYSAWREQHPEGRTKTVLQREGYVFGWGLRTRAEASIGAGPLALRGEIDYGRLSSIQGLDRSQERVVHDQQVTEAALEYGASLWATDLPGELEFGLAYEGRQRVSGMPGVERQYKGSRLLFRLVAPF